ncbi:helix-turn-helix transcriptional regulator [Schinkia azotoformans]|uniref:helix-turn-helix domain-containing protein n=1 Tax=Schinkia azotoformans TaxID=1454 RepID=UPI002E234B4C|nr:helix-turn-helix transcriptional regulator [Schinkia azotoformans]
MFNKIIFSSRISQLRETHSLLMKDMAKIVGISIQGYSLLEKGVNTPSANTLISIADYFNVSIDYLVGRSDDPTLHHPHKKDAAESE